MPRFSIVEGLTEPMPTDLANDASGADLADSEMAAGTSSAFLRTSTSKMTQGDLFGSDFSKATGTF